MFGLRTPLRNRPKYDAPDSMAENLSRRMFLGCGVAMAATGASAAGIGRLKMGHSNGGFDFTVHNRTELDSLAAAARLTPTSYAGKTVGVYAGDYGTTMVDMHSIVLASAMILYGVSNLAATVPGFDFSMSSNIVVTRLTITRLHAVDTSQTAVNYTGGSTNIAFISNEISADPLSTYDYNYYVGVSGGAGSFSNNDAVEVRATLNGTLRATGTYITGQPLSSSSVYAILDSTGTASGSSDGWNGKILQNVGGTVWRQLSNPANVGGFGTGASAVMSGINTSNTVNSTTTNSGLVVTDNYIHDVKWPVAGGLQVAPSYQRNLLLDCYTSFGDFDADISGAIIKDNRGAHVWARDTDGNVGTSGPHSSLFGFSQNTVNTTNVTFQGNVFVIGWHRGFNTPTWFPAVKVVPYATGPKMNDMGNYCTGRIDNGTPGNAGQNLTLSAVQGAPAITVGMVVRWTGGPDAGVAIQSGSGLSWILAGGASYSVAAGTELTITAVCDGWVIMSNLLVCNGTIGFEHAFCRNNTFLYNTIISPQDSIIVDNPEFPQYEYHDIYPGNIVGRNVTTGFDLGVVTTASTAKSNGIISPDFYTRGLDSVVVNYAISAVGNPQNYANLYVGRQVGGGLDFSRIDNTNALAVFTPLMTGRLSGNDYGHTVGYDFTTGVSSYPTTPTQPVSNVANGINSSRVHFNGSSRTRWAGSASAPVVGWSDDTLMTIVAQVSVSGDVTGGTIVGGKNSNVLFSIQNSNVQNPGLGNTLKLLMSNTSGPTTTLSATSSLRLRVADGLTTCIWIVDIDNYKIWFIKANATAVIIDPFVNVATFTGAAFQKVNGSTTLTLGQTYSGTASYTGDMGVVAISDAIVDPTTSAGLGKFVARDGLPVSYGSDGSTLFGAAARVFMNDTASSWNAGTQNDGNGGTFTPSPANCFTDA